MELAQFHGSVDTVVGLRERALGRPQGDTARPAELKLGHYGQRARTCPSTVSPPTKVAMRTVTKKVMNGSPAVGRCPGPSAIAGR